MPSGGNQQATSILGYPLAVLRGISQVEFIANPLTAVVFLIALFVGGWQFGVFGLLGALTATVTALVFGADHERVVTGLEGFCGTLIGVSLVLYLDVRWITVLLVVGGCVAGSVLTSAMNSVLSPYNLPTFTAPFCVITSVMVIGGPSFDKIWRDRNIAELPAKGGGSTALSWTDVWHGLFNGIGEIFFQDTWYVGLIFLIGIVIGSRVAAVAAVVASAVGILIAWGLGAPAATIEAGLYGYNAVLVAMALAGIFVVLSPLGGLYALVGAVAAAGLTGATTDLFAPVGGHTLTWPFVLVAWVFLAAVPVFRGLRRTEA